MINRVFILLVSVLFSLVALSDSNLTALAGSMPPKLSHATLVNHADPSQKLNILVWLKGKNSAGLQQLLTNLYTSGNSQYHKFITPEQFQANYAPDNNNVTAVVNYLTEQGLDVVRVPSNSAFVQINATVAQAEAVFNVRINKYSLNGKQYYSNDQAVTLNSNLASMVSAISGLDNFQQLHFNHTQIRPISVKSEEIQGISGYTPQQLQSAYGVDQLLRNNITGSGQVIAVIDEYDDPNVESDLNTYSAQFHLPPCTTLNGCFAKFNQYGESAPLPKSSINSAGEIALDTQLIHSLAPGAKICLFEMEYVDWIDFSSTNIAIALNTIVSKNLASIISNSYDFGGEVADSPLEFIFQQAAAQGISINFSSGDVADNRIPYGKSTIQPPSVYYPASSPWVTAVGGTTLLLTSYNSYKIETGWACFTQTECGSTGGLSQYYKAQPWQTAAIGLINAGGYGLVGTQRAVPDISMLANSNTGAVTYNSYWPGTPVTDYWGTVGGTSVACPLFSAIVALANQARTSQGLSTVGLVTSLLYTMPYDMHHGIAPITNVVAPASTPTSVLTGGHHWNDITGLGSPYAPLFVKALIDSK